MSVLGAVQNFINQVSGQVNKSDNPLGLSAGQIDEINQILTLIKAIISDGIKRGDISKMVVLMGEMAEHMPELKPEIDEIINDLKKLSKKLFEDPESLGINDSPEQGLLGMEMGLANVEDTDGLLGSSLTSSGQGLPIGEQLDPRLLEETEDERSQLAEGILNFVNDNVILPQANFEALSNGLQKIERRAGLKSVDNPSIKTDEFSKDPIASDYYVDGNSAAPAA
tara:strand:- start:10108 stop:10782 length:675 start_codon:yes stop_codon:yes gene_type:complete